MDEFNNNLNNGFPADNNDFPADKDGFTADDGVFSENSDTFSNDHAVKSPEVPASAGHEAAHTAPRHANPRRRKRSQAQIFKENYLPLIISAAALVLIFIFIIGSAGRAIQKHRLDKQASIAVSESAAAEKKRLDSEALLLLSQAQQQAAGFNYLGAIATIDTFSGDISQYPDLANKRSEYAAAQQDMVAWSDPSKVVNLSFHMLISDTERAFKDDEYGGAYNRNFVTVGEFSQILQQLYDNGYILVNLTDFTTATTNEAGDTIYTAKQLYLPRDKKPVMITQTGVNYYKYMTDGNDDGLPDEKGAGFASRLIIGPDGKVTCEMVDREGKTLVGNYDLVPILDAFIAEHPDFSYNGARATLAVTGYDGVFGYRTDAASKEAKGQEFHDKEVAGAKAVADALRAEGYRIACYTYDNVEYGSYSAAEIEEDLKKWTAEVTPVLGDVDTLVFAQGSDIAGSDTTYGSETYDVLKKAGFHYYLGFCDSGTPWAQLGSDYVRMGRILVTGSHMYHNPNWFTGLFDAKEILDKTRGEVPG